ncbi:DUF3710 domain-containing protein [Hoyosella subflava]|uniref:DUF3710 domain-containing protein n=1 Tax=Hoyosella subflava (strain DSM 45089 / JCM 17490 / NBRC 109087 / DQS3-9A1) TaxID=443218 RepID=F6ELH0_HOYSD|nr:DUF3710 domain-containing protein [Hoyosella subflava]AEF40220.1 hypothetical protein AS9A_1771 [Hoyosella subflava DQS3-9A1]
MGFLRRNKNSEVNPESEAPPETGISEGDVPGSRESDRSNGPFDSGEVEQPAAGEKRLDLGAFSLPLPAGAQVQVEMAKSGGVQGIHLATQFGRITVAAYAAPRSSGMWREVSGELSESLRRDGAEVTTDSGPWGPEVTGVTKSADIRFIGVDGPRWMIRLVAAGPPGAGVHNGDLARTAREVLSGTIVSRGDAPLPVRTPLPITLPKALQQQLAAMQQQQAMQAAKASAAQQSPQQSPQQAAPVIDSPESGEADAGNASEGAERPQ